MRIGIRHCLAATALIGVSLALALRAGEAAAKVEYACDSNVYDIERVEAAFPFAVPAALALGGAALCIRRGHRECTRDVPRREV